MQPWSAWLQASRPLAAANVAVPLILGQALAFGTRGQFSWQLFGVVQLLGVLVQLFIVFANDFADREADALNRSPTLLSGGSRVIQDGKLPAHALSLGAWIMLGAQLVVGLYLGWSAGRWWTLALLGLAALLMWAYSYSPLRLSYRGQGELLQGVGVGVVLPVLGFYVQAGSFADLPIWGLGPCFILAYVGNLLTALPDYEGDKAAKKRTYPVRFGQFQARRHALQMSMVAVGFGWLVVPGLPWWARVLIVTIPQIPLIAAARLLGTADASNQNECLRFVLWVSGAANLAMLAWTLAALIRGWVAWAGAGLA
ncbi:prenyltransferase [Pseudenhygromyxa sp. WMMC2535]|uniref:prenyltransferase n=1 Tax=Pseudenhygromyxa sp. WMMC2535 TaxID=2712867 RepID=UPI001556DBE7|nr:prenyltransferase [Pseudenhygromyxa sp. WMMC2535]NVB37872.1 prenyltransferase [Pseudenhygromyxa sp. WMMC2535]